MSHPARALARFCLEFVAVLLGFDDPGREFELRAALAEADDRGVADQVDGLARRHRKVYADHQRLVGPAVSALRGEYLPPEAGKLLGATALHALRNPPGSFPWAAELRRGPLAEALDDAFRASQREDGRGVARALHADVLRQAPPALAAILRGVAEVYGEDDGELVERLPALQRTTPPAGLDLDRGRESRADLVWAILRAERVTVREVETGRTRRLDHDELVDAILRDPRWDDIDAAVGQSDVVARVLGETLVCPAISLKSRGLPDVFVAEIVP